MEALESYVRIWTFNLVLLNIFRGLTCGSLKLHEFFAASKTTSLSECESIKERIWLQLIQKNINFNILDGFGIKDFFEEHVNIFLDVLGYTRCLFSIESLSNFNDSFITVLLGKVSKITLLN
jgi:hypothetical protein